MPELFQLLNQPKYTIIESERKDNHVQNTKECHQSSERSRESNRGR